jgi:hypothetical protein
MRASRRPSGSGGSGGALLQWMSGAMQARARRQEGSGQLRQ